MAKNTGRKKTESVAETLCSFNAFLCDIVISIYMCVILLVLPLYNKGYAQIGTEKENFFIKCLTYGGKALLPVFLLWLLFGGIAAVQKKELPKVREWPAKLWKSLSVTDRFAALYGIAVILSYLFTNYRKEALWGTASWRMGMWTQLGSVIVYFMISRMWQRKDWIEAFVLPVSAVVFSLGYVNKFGLFPIDPAYANPSFISTIGNINWYCGYLVTVLFGSVYLLWRMEPEMNWKKGILMAYVAVGFASLATQGSSSGIVTLAVIMFLLFGMSVKDSARMECLWQEVCLFSGACLITYILRALKVLPGDQLLEGMTEILTFSLCSIVMTVVSMMILYLIHRSRRKTHYSEEKIAVGYKVVCVGIVAMAAILLLFITINTLLDGVFTANVTNASIKNFLVFNKRWGSSRGATWEAGIRCFLEADLLHKLFGVGPDCMYIFLTAEGSSALQNMVYECFGAVRLTNAHNEWLTILVDVGVLGVFSYAGMMVSAIRSMIREGENSPLIGACGVCVLAYTVNNMFSFQQVMNISTVFVILGIGGNLMRARRECLVR